MNAPYYRTVRGSGRAEIVVRRSQFIGFAGQAASEEEAAAFIEEIRRQHKQASHHCFAYVCGERDRQQKASDDGEPAGTAGKPILEVIRQQQLSYTVVVVTRYFGGVLLGAGGLVRAYADGAAAAIAAAGVVYRVLRVPVRVSLGYSWLGKLENGLRGRGVDFGDIVYADRVTVTCRPLASDAERFAAWVADLTAGQAETDPGDPEYADCSELPAELRDRK